MAGTIFYTWFGMGQGWLEPGKPGQQIVSANIRNRFYPINYGLSSMVYGSTARNTADFSNQHAGIESEAIKQYRQIFQS